MPVPENELLEALQLNLVPGLGPRTQQILSDHIGSPSEIFSAPTEQLLQISGIGPKLANGIRQGRDPSNAKHELARCQELGIEIHLKASGAYPKMLLEIPDAPIALYARGKLEPRDMLAVAIVGSRRCTLYGKQQAERLGKALAHAGITVVSGLARGVDAAAHRGALEAGGRTIAVAATGLGTTYPPEHKELATEISRRGAVVSESSLAQLPKAGLFPQRNRIISGMSLGIVVVEADRKSGALHTARHAMEQGREVFALPGRIDSPASRGCHDLIRDGVALVRDVNDILEELGPLVQPIQRTEKEIIHIPRELNLNEMERKILSHIAIEPRHIDEIVRETKLETSRVLATLTTLEMKRVTRRLPGGFLVRGSS